MKNILFSIFLAIMNIWAGNEWNLVMALIITIPAILGLLVPEKK